MQEAKRSMWFPLWQIHYQRKSSGRERKHYWNKTGSLNVKQKPNSQETVVHVTHCTVNAGNVIIGAMRNSVQSCEWAGRYFMNGGDHVIAAPPKADISHWLSTRTQEISPLKQYHFNETWNGRDTHDNISCTDYSLCPYVAVKIEERATRF